MTEREWKRKSGAVIAAAVALCVWVTGAAVAQAQEGSGTPAATPAKPVKRDRSPVEYKRYTNPYIFDGVIWESPFKFEYPVEEVRTSFDERGKPFLEHLTSATPKAIEADWKAAYKARKEVAPGFLVIGYVFLTQRGHMAFTLQNTKTLAWVVVEVIPAQDGGGSVLRADGRVHPSINVAYRRSWMAYSPKGLPEYSVPVDGH